MTEDQSTKEKIFAACQDRFIRDGFIAVSVDEIAADLGISKKTLYKYFESKEEIVRQIMERLMGTVRMNVEHILMSDTSTVEKLSQVITVLATNVNRLAPAFGRDIQRRMPELWKHIEEFRRQRIADVFARIMQQGAEDGTMRPQSNSRIFLMSILAAIERIMQPNVLANESFSAGEAVREIMNVFFQGVLTKKGREQFELLQHHSTD